MSVKIKHLIQGLRVGLLVMGLCAVVSVSAQETDEISAAVMAASEPAVIQRVDAPDGVHAAEVTIYPCVDIGGQEASYERLDLIDTGTGEARLVAEQTIYCGGLGGYGLSVLRWTMDSAFLYYTDSREGVPDGLVVDWVPPIWRVQVADLQVDNLGQARFSPDGKALAAWDQTQVRVMPVESAEVAAFDLLPAGLQIVSALWLPDNAGILYLQADAPFNSTRSTVTHIDLNAGTQTVLLDNGG